MTEQDVKRMWVIDSKITLGDKITDEEKEFYDSHLKLMFEEMEDNFIHWKFRYKSI